MKKLFKPKQPSEEFYREFDFERPFRGQGETGITVESITVLDETDDNADVGTDLYDPTKTNSTGTSLFLFVRGGVHGHRYKFTVVVRGDLTDEVHEIDATMPVIER